MSDKVREAIVQRERKPVVKVKASVKVTVTDKQVPHEAIKV